MRRAGDRRVRVASRQRHDAQRRLLEPHRASAGERSALRRSRRPSGRAPRDRRRARTRTAPRQRAGDEAGAARRRRVPELLPAGVALEDGAVMRPSGTRSRGGRTTSEARATAEKRKSTQAFTSASNASGGERASPARCWSGTWRDLGEPGALALREEAAEERGGGAAVEAVAVVEDLELHRAGQSSDRPSIPSTRETGRGTSRGPPPGRPRGARAGRGRTGAAGERRYTDRAGPAVALGACAASAAKRARPPVRPRHGWRVAFGRACRRGSGQPFPRVRLRSRWTRSASGPSSTTRSSTCGSPSWRASRGSRAASAPPGSRSRGWCWPASPSTCTASGSRSSATPR